MISLIIDLSVAIILLAVFILALICNIWRYTSPNEYAFYVTARLIDAQSHIMSRNGVLLLLAVGVIHSYHCIFWANLIIVWRTLKGMARFLCCCLIIFTGPLGLLFLHFFYIRKQIKVHLLYIKQYLRFSLLTMLLCTLVYAMCIVLLHYGTHLITIIMLSQIIYSFVLVVDVYNNILSSDVDSVQPNCLDYSVACVILSGLFGMILTPLFVCVYLFSYINTTNVFLSICVLLASSFIGLSSGAFWGMCVGYGSYVIYEKREKRRKG